MASKFPQIQIVRQYYTYEFINPCVISVQIRLFIFVKKSTLFYIYPFKDYLPELKATMQSGQELSILPFQELNKIIGEEITLEHIRGFMYDLFGVNQGLDESLNFAIIMLPVTDYDYYDELVLSWKEPIEEESSTDPLTKEATIVRHFPPILNSSLYVDLQINEKYSLTHQPNITEIVGVAAPLDLAYEKHRQVPETAYRTILDDKKHHVVRFERGLENEITIEYHVGVHSTIRQWLYFGMILGIFPQIFWFYFASHNIQYLAPFVGGILAGLIGLRIVLFHDLELLRRWNWVYFGLIGLNAALIAYYLLSR